MSTYWVTILVALLFCFCLGGETDTRVQSITYVAETKVKLIQETELEQREGVFKPKDYLATTEVNSINAVTKTEGELKKTSAKSEEKPMHVLSKTEGARKDLAETQVEPIEDFITYFFFKEKKFIARPDQLPCIQMDPFKKQVAKIGNEGIRMCDLCPSFPQKRLTNVLINALPETKLLNAQFPECFDFCFNVTTCVAFSHIGKSCYLHNTTASEFKSEPGWTTVLMTQPIGLIDKWSYVRHTSVTGSPHHISKQADFVSCLALCERNSACRTVSYSFHNSDCFVFNSTNTIDAIDHTYGFASAFNIRQIPYEKDVANWRFSNVEAMLATANKSEDGEVIRRKLRQEMLACLADEHCYGIRFQNSTREYTRIRIDERMTYPLVSTLLYPKLNSGLHKYLGQFDFLADVQMINTLDVNASLSISLEECLEQLTSSTVYTKASFSFRLKICHLGDALVHIQENKEDKYVTIFPKPKVQSSLMKFVKVPFIGMNATTEPSLQCHSNCEETCAALCGQNCSHLLITYETNGTKCFFFRNNDSLYASKLDNSFLFVKHGNFDFSLAALNQLDPLQKRHFYSCFSQTNTNEKTALIGKRGLFDFVSTVVNKVGSFVVKVVTGKKVGNNLETGVSVLDDVIITAGNVGSLVTSAIKGDWEGVGKAAREIPIIRDYELYRDFGVAIYEGDWKSAALSFLNILASDSFELITWLIPCPLGKLFSFGAKIMKKILTGVIKVSLKTSNIKKGVAWVMDNMKKKEVQDYMHDMDKKIESTVESITDDIKTIEELAQGMNITSRNSLPQLRVKTMSASNKGTTGKRSYSYKYFFFLGIKDIKRANMSSSFNPMPYVQGKYRKQNSFFILVPTCWDGSNLNEDIKIFNRNMINILSTNNVKYIDPNMFLKKEHYGRNGILLNIIGKRLLALQLRNLTTRTLSRNHYLKNSDTEVFNYVKWVRILI